MKVTDKKRVMKGTTVEEEEYVPDMLKELWVAGEEMAVEYLTQMEVEEVTMVVEEATEEVDEITVVGEEVMVMPKAEIKEEEVATQVGIIIHKTTEYNTHN